MRELYKNLFVGSLEEYQELDNTDDKNVRVIHAAKEPYHREYVGYEGRGAPKEHPEYLRAIRGNKIALNIVDAKESKYFDKDLIFAAVKNIMTFLEYNVDAAKMSEDPALQIKVYIHCNLGESRAPSLALMTLVAMHFLPSDYEEAKKAFISIYPKFSPGEWVETFMKEVWPEFLKYYEVPAGEVTVDMTENLEKLPWENINVPIGIEDLPKAMKEAAKKVKKEKHKF